MNPVRDYDAVLLAAGRPGPDPVAAPLGYQHKAAVPVAGVAMIERVITALSACDRIKRIVVVIEADADISDLAKLQGLIDSGELIRVASAESPAASVQAALAAVGDLLPCLVTTADHALLTVEMLEQFLDAVPQQADVAVALAQSEGILERYPDAVRTLIRFSDGPFSGCNLFALQSESARKAVQYWRSIELARKTPWRLIRSLGVFTLLRYLLRLLPSQAAMQSLSGKIGARACAITLDIPEAAIDVDKPADLELVERILAREESRVGAWNQS